VQRKLHEKLAETATARLGDKAKAKDKDKDKEGRPKG
jgi:hypothetical protein